MEKELTALWRKYGVRCNHWKLLKLNEYTKVVKSHNKVVTYLENHPDIAKDYLEDQTGKFKYFDILDLAEKEKGA